MRNKDTAARCLHRGANSLKIRPWCHAIEFSYLWKRWLSDPLIPPAEVCNFSLWQTTGCQIRECSIPIYNQNSGVTCGHMVENLFHTISVGSKQWLKSKQCPRQQWTAEKVGLSGVSAWLEWDWLAWSHSQVIKYQRFDSPLGASPYGLHQIAFSICMRRTRLPESL